MNNSRIDAALKKIEIAKKVIKKSVYRSYVDNDSLRFKNWLGEHFDTRLFCVSDYEELSSIADGINFNGLFVYSLNTSNANNIYLENDEWWENEKQRKYLFFADDDTSWYCYCSEDNLFCVLDKPSGDRVISFNSDGELLAVALETALL